MNPQTYIVQQNDNLSTIGQRYGVDYNQIAKDNGIANPNLIYPGQNLKINAAAPLVAPAASPSRPAAPTAAPAPQAQSQGGGWQSMPGYAGWDPTAAAADFAATGGRGKEGAATATSNPTSPAFDLIGVTNSAYNTPEIQAAQKAITDRETALATASAGIDDNPFYSEATRVGKQAQLTTQANNDIKVHQDNLARLQADAAIKVNAAMGQYNIQRQQYQDTLAQFNTVLQAGGLINASPQDLASYSVKTGIPVSQLQSIQDKQKKDSTKTAMVTSNSGVISVINAETGEVISQTQPGVGAVTKATGTGTTGTTKESPKQTNADRIKANLSSVAGGDGYVSPDDYAAAMRDAIQAGYTTKNAESILGGYKNPKNQNYYSP